MAARWGELTAREILGPLQGEVISGSSGSTFTAVSTDSRKVGPGEIFFALQGERFDGHDFVKDAARRGASGIVVRRGFPGAFPDRDRPVVIAVSDTLNALGDLARWWRHQFKVQVAAITGSAGKTTTKEMAASILGLGAGTLRNTGNFNNLVGLPLTLLSLDETHCRAVLEMGMNHPGEIGRLTEITDPDVGLITNVAKAHLEGVGDILGVARAKVELLEGMAPRAQTLLNGDDELLMKVASSVGRSSRTFGLGPRNDVRAQGIVNLGKDGMRFELCHAGGSMPVRLKVPGQQNVMNALAASAVVLSLKVVPEHILEGLERYEGMSGRFKVISLRGGITMVDDTYNSNPFSLKAALHSTAGILCEGGRMIAVLGEMRELGRETPALHREAGEMAAETGVSFLIAMGEHAGDMIRGAIGRGLPREMAEEVFSHEEMAHRVRDVMREGDVILLKGSHAIGLEKVVEIISGCSTN